VNGMEILFFTFAAFGYLLSTLLAFTAVASRRRGLLRFSYFTGLASCTFQFFALVTRFLSTGGRIPLTTTYETMLTGSFIIVVAYFIFARRYDWVRMEGADTLGPFVFASAFLALAFATVFSTAPVPLVPALRSNWLLFHVLLAFIGEAFFVLAFAASVLHLIKRHGEKRRSAQPSSRPSARLSAWASAWSLAWLPARQVVFAAVSAGAATFFLVWLAAWKFLSRHQGRSPLDTTPLVAGFVAGLVVTSMLLLLSKRLAEISPPAERLSRLAYDSVAAGLPIYTLGALIFGAIWAEKAWGRWWGWDPKETWALITWLVFMAYIYARKSGHVSEDIASYLAIAGFMATMFTLFGVNFLVHGLHSYL
jgi:cytochrome c-type biogenesis protein CcsB